MYVTVASGAVLTLDAFTLNVVSHGFEAVLTLDVFTLNVRKNGIGHGEQVKKEPRSIPQTSFLFF